MLLKKTYCRFNLSWKQIYVSIPCQSISYSSFYQYVSNTQYVYIKAFFAFFTHIHTNYRLHKIYTSFRYFEKIGTLEFCSLNLSRLIYQYVLFLNIVDKKHNHVSHNFQLNQFNIITIQNVFSCFQICRTLETKIYLIQGADISNSRRRLMCLKDREIECYFSLSS